MSIYTEKYAKARERQGKTYTPKKRYDKSYEEFISLGITIIKDSNNVYGYRVYQNGKERPIVPWKTGNKGSKIAPYVVYNAHTKPYKQKKVSLATLVYLYTYKGTIKAGYVVDHIDNDSFNNDISNLQVLTIGENIKKNPQKTWVNPYGSGEIIR